MSVWPRQLKLPELRKKDKRLKLSVLLNRLPLPKNLQRGEKERPPNRKPRQRWQLVSPRLSRKGSKLRSKPLVSIRRLVKPLQELLNSRGKSKNVKPPKRDVELLSRRKEKDNSKLLKKRLDKLRQHVSRNSAKKRRLEPRLRLPKKLARDSKEKRDKLPSRPQKKPPVSKGSVKRQKPLLLKEKPKGLSVSALKLSRRPRMLKPKKRPRRKLLAKDNALPK
jgi:hypothetical protein